MALKGKARDTIWTDGSRLDSGGVGAACAWRAREGWTGKRFHLGSNKETAKGRSHSVPDEARWRASLSHLSRRVTERRSRDATQWTVAHARPGQSLSPGGFGLRRRQLRRVPRSLAGRDNQLFVRACCDWALPARENDRPPESCHGRLLEARQRQEGAAPPPLHGAQGLDPPDPEAVEDGREGLRVEASEGAVGRVAVEGGGHRDCAAGVPGGHESGV